MLRDEINAALKDAMKARDQRRVSTLRLINSAIQTADIEAGGLGKPQLADDALLGILQKMIKQRQESADIYEKGGRAELAAREKEELAILNTYLPQAMSPDELAKVVRETIAELGATSKAQMGAVMKALQEKAAGRADGKTLSAEVARQLS